ncbi:Uncharacterised protein [uncultured archaeon]|nr:Uncharacterised protein [uncultured archaeon]
MEASREVRGERIGFCSLPSGDKHGFVCSMSYAPDKKGQERIDKVKPEIIRERMAMLGTEILEERVRSWAKAYPDTVVVRGGTEGEALEVWGFEMIRHIDEKNATIVTVLPIVDENEKAGIMARLKGVWPNAEMLSVTGGSENASVVQDLAKLRREGKQAVVFK